MLNTQGPGRWEVRNCGRYVNDWIVDRGHMLEDRPPLQLGLFESRLSALVKERVEAYRIGRDTSRLYREMYTDANREGWVQTQDYLRAMNRRMAAPGGRLLVASWPLLVDLEKDPFADVWETIARFCLKEGIPRHDLRAALLARPSKSLWVHRVDMHPNETAHRLAAESLAPAVRDLLR